MNRAWLYLKSPNGSTTTLRLDQVVAVYVENGQTRVDVTYGGNGGTFNTTEDADTVRARIGEALNALAEADS